MGKSDFVRKHLLELLRGALADIDGKEDLSRRLRAQAKLRLISMSDNELREFASIVSPPDRPIELVYQDLRSVREEFKATRGEWTGDLTRRSTAEGRERVKGRILLIEDDPTLRMEITSALTEAGFAVVGVPDFSQALLKLGDFHPDMAILDEALPTMDGRQACHQLHAFGISIILLGRDSSNEAWQKWAESGADFYLIKPFSSLELVARMRAILRRHKQATTTGDDPGCNEKDRSKQE